MQRFFFLQVTYTHALSCFCSLLFVFVLRAILTCHVMLRTHHSATRKAEKQTLYKQISSPPNTPLVNQSTYPPVSVPPRRPPQVPSPSASYPQLRLCQTHLDTYHRRQASTSHSAQSRRRPPRAPRSARRTRDRRRRRLGAGHGSAPWRAGAICRVCGSSRAVRAAWAAPALPGSVVGI